MACDKPGRQDGASGSGKVSVDVRLLLLQDKVSRLVPVGAVTLLGERYKTCKTCRTSGLQVVL